ncbi:MAG: division/cell wall cluster transcriptional repressor MraZ [Acidobacteriota bacterium]
MLRGSAPAKVDGKGRLKIPSEYRSIIEGEFGTMFYVTSIDGRAVRIYPFPVWEENEKKLKGKSSLNPSFEKFYNLTNIYGRMVEMDSQGRILIPAFLRKDANINGEVAVIGKILFLEVINMKDVREQLEKSKLTREELNELASHGIM